MAKPTPIGAAIKKPKANPTKPTDEIAADKEAP